MTARSTVLGVLVVQDTVVHVLATCPAGQTVIVKDVHYVNVGPAAENAWVALSRPGVGVVYLGYGSVQTGAIASWSGWAVLEPGDQLICSVGAATFNFWASGTVLSGTAPPT